MKQRVVFECRRCIKSFSYEHRRGRLRYYCRPCKKMEAKDANDFFNGLRSQRNRERHEHPSNSQ